MGRYYFNEDFYVFFGGGGAEPIVRSLIIIVTQSSDTDTTTKLYAAKFNPKKSYTIMSNSYSQPAGESPLQHSPSPLYKSLS